MATTKKKAAKKSTKVKVNGAKPVNRIAKPSKNGAEANGHDDSGGLSIKDRVILDIAHRIGRLAPEVDEAQRDYERSKGETARLKKEWEELAEELTRLSMEVAEAEAGQLRLFKANGEPHANAAAPKDEAADRDLSVIGATDAQLAALESVGLKTIRDFESLLREHPEVWVRKVTEAKGISDRTAEKLFNGYQDFRLKNPIPTADDSPAPEANGEVIPDEQEAQG